MFSAPIAKVLTDFEKRSKITRGCYFKFEKLFLCCGKFVVFTTTDNFYTNAFYHCASWLTRLD